MEVDQTAPVVAETAAASDNSLQQENSIPADLSQETDAEQPALAPETEGETQETPLADTPSAPEKEDKQLSNAIREVEKKNAAFRKMIDIQASLVSGSPELIHKLAESDSDIANQVVEKVWGDSGVRSYKQLLERAKLEQLKETNPELYETRLEMSQMKTELETRRNKELEEVKNKFLKEKKILENEYDPRYKQLVEALSLVNPMVLEKDFKAGLEAAYNVAFSKPASKAPVYVPTNGNIGSGQPAPVIPKTNPQTSDHSQWLAQSLNKVGGYNIKI